MVQLGLADSPSLNLQKILIGYELVLVMFTHCSGGLPGDEEGGARRLLRAVLVVLVVLAFPCSRAIRVARLDARCSVVMVGHVCILCPPSPQCEHRLTLGIYKYATSFHTSNRL